MFPDNKKQTNEDPRFNDKQVGKRLAIIRKLKKIPLEKMAQLLKTSIGTIQRVEQGEKHIPNSWLPKLAVSFKIDSHWISTGIRPTGAGHSI